MTYFIIILLKIKKISKQKKKVTFGQSIVNISNFLLEKGKLN